MQFCETELSLTRLSKMFLTNKLCLTVFKWEQDRERFMDQMEVVLSLRGDISAKGVWEGTSTEMEVQAVMCQVSHYILCVCTHVEDTTYIPPSPEASRGQRYNEACGGECFWGGCTSLFRFQGQARWKRR